MSPQLVLSERRCLWALAALAWLGGNWAALNWIECYESRQLEGEFDVSAEVIRSYESRMIKVPLGADRISLWYRYRPPLRWSSGQKVPLVVFLHGAGQRGSDNVQQLHSIPALLCEDDMRQRYSCAVLAPQCPEHWHWSSQLDGDADLLDGVSQMIDDVLADRRIDADRVYLTGVSMGGFGCWEFGMRDPARFAAIVPICGGGDESQAARLVGIPVWAVHGAADTVVAVTASRTMIAALEAAGGQPRYSELAGVGHNCWDPVFHGDSEILSWMFRQSRQWRPRRSESL